MIPTPDKIYGALFHEVQMSEIFPDSKTFVDAIPRINSEEIIRAYENEKLSSDFDLLTFVNKYFQLPEETHIEVEKKGTLKEHIKALWPKLMRESKSEQNSSLLPLKNPFVVPGGRFREVYYWDTYFTILGLIADGFVDEVRDILDNFAELIHTYGFIPNGNRSYYLSRSQPPFFALMASYYSNNVHGASLDPYIDAIEKEYQFWMEKGSRCVDIEGHKLNRYYDALDIPRQESYREDIETAKGEKALYRHIRAAAESGWDFSSRWFRDGKNIETICTTDIIPVDLNCLLFLYEDILQQYYVNHDTELAHRYKKAMKNRSKAMNALLLHPTYGVYSDYNFVDEYHSDVLHLAIVFPLITVLPTVEIAQKISELIEHHFLAPGGLLTTTIDSGEQWDAPNGWAPLQYIAISGLENYGYQVLADTIKSRWLTLNEKVYHSTGKMMEKYNVMDLTLPAGGGEYPVQDGFGWTNGVYRILKG